MRPLAAAATTRGDASSMSGASVSSCSTSQIHVRLAWLAFPQDRASARLWCVLRPFSAWSTRRRKCRSMRLSRPAYSLHDYGWIRFRPCDPRHSMSPFSRPLSRPPFWLLPVQYSIATGAQTLLYNGRAIRSRRVAMAARSGVLVCVVEHADVRRRSHQPRSCLRER